MSKEIQSRPISNVRVEHYQTETTNTPLAMLMNLTPTATPDTPTLLYLRGIPKEFADALERKVMQAMTSQVGYEQFLNTLNTPSV